MQNRLFTARSYIIPAFWTGVEFVEESIARRAFELTNCMIVFFPLTPINHSK